MDVSNGAYGLALRSQDIAKIAFLYLNNGKWAGDTVVSEDWVRQSTRPIVKTGETMECLQSYGYLWWVGTIGKYSSFLELGMADR